MKTILFQGDSITDVLRKRDDEIHAGMGYPLLVKGTLGFDHPNAYRFYNRGISGDRIVDLYARIKLHAINLKPDLVSILVGVNDAYHELLRHNGVDAGKFYKIYKMYVEEIREALPDVRFMILEPFLLEGAATEDTEEEPGRFAYFDKEVKLRALMARKVAEEENVPFVPLQEKFDEAAKLAPNDYWLYDGVHPTTAGHELIKREWLKCFYSLDF